MDLNVTAQGSYVPMLANSVLLPLLLLSLTGQRQAPITSNSFRQEYDYVIVGAGMGGSVVASRLSEVPCVSVLLLEAGGPAPLISEVPGIALFLWNTDIDWQYRTVPQRYSGDLLLNKEVLWPSGKALGGSSVLSGMLYARGNKRNYDDWEAQGAKGWGYKDVLPYFKKLEDNRDPEYVANGYHGVGGPQSVHRPRYQPEIRGPIFEEAKNLGYKIVDPNNGRQSGFYDLQATMRSGQRCSTAKAYLVPAENRTNLDILARARVRKVIVKNHRAVGVQFDYQGKTFEVKAKREVIMSAGTVNSAQLLMLSGIGPRKELERFKIPVIEDLPVGENLQDHFGSNVLFELGPQVQPYLVKIASPESISQYVQQRTGPLASAEFCTAMAFLKNNETHPKVDFPNHELYFAEIFSGFGTGFGLTPEANARLYLPYATRPTWTCISQILNPRSRGTVTLRSADPYDPPNIDPNYFEDPRDFQPIVQGLKNCMRIGTSPALRRLGSKPIASLVPGCEQYQGNEDKYYTCQARSIVFTLNHEVGTARMGHRDDPRTVVDPKLRVKNVKGLRVIDASVMPTIPSGNTGIPTIMIAEKASDIIKETIRCNDRKRGSKNGKDKWHNDEDEYEYLWDD